MLKSPTISVGRSSASAQRVMRSRKSSFWPNLALTVAVGHVAAGGDVDVLEHHCRVRQPHADVARLAVVLPVVPVDLDAAARG